MFNNLILITTSIYAIFCALSVFAQSARWAHQKEPPARSLWVQLLLFIFFSGCAVNLIYSLYIGAQNWSFAIVVFIIMWYLRKKLIIQISKNLKKSTNSIINEQ